MALFDDGINEARSLGTQILDALIEGNRQREKAAADKPPARALSKLDVIAEANLRSYPFEANKLTQIFTSQAGIYTKINHWVVQLLEGGVKADVQLYYGADPNNVAILDTSTETYVPFSNPNELIVPPQMNIYVMCLKKGIITLSSTVYQLSA